MLAKVNKAEMAGMIESIKKYLRSCCGLVGAPLAFAIMITILVKIYYDSPKYATSENETIARMLHLPQDRIIDIIS